MSTGGNVTDTGSAVSEGAGCARAATHASVRTAATPASVPPVRRTSNHEHLAIYISIPPRLLLAGIVAQPLSRRQWHTFLNLAGKVPDLRAMLHFG